MGTVSETTSGRTNPNDPPTIPVGDGAKTTEDAATEIFTGNETSETTNSSDEEKITVDNGLKFSDTKLELSPENREKLEEAKASIEKDAHDAKVEAIAENIGNILVKAFFSGGISFGQMFNIATSDSLSRSFEKIDENMEHRMEDAERAAVDLEHKEAIGDMTAEQLGEKAEGIREDIHSMNDFAKDYERLQGMSMTDKGDLTDKISKICDAGNNEEIAAHREEISSMLKQEIRDMREELSEFNKEHRGDKSEETVQQKEGIEERIAELKQELRQFDNYVQSYDKLMDATDISKLSDDIMDKGDFNSRQDVYDAKQDIIKELRAEEKIVSHREFIARSEETYGGMEKGELQEKYSELHEEARGLEHLRNVDSAHFTDDMQDYLKEIKMEMREIECVYRLDAIEKDEPYERDDFERPDWEDRSHNDSGFSFSFGGNNNSFNDAFNNGMM